VGLRDEEEMIRNFCAEKKRGEELVQRQLLVAFKDVCMNVFYFFYFFAINFAKHKSGIRE